MTTIKAYNIDTRDFEYVKQNNTGLLISGSGGSGDASSSNQVLQLNAAINSNLAIYNQLATQTDRILYDTDLIYNQLVSSNINQYGKLSTIAEASEISSEYLQGILTKATGLQHQSTKYTLSAVSSLAPDTTPAYTQPPEASGLDGWYFKNVAVSQPSQIYYYSYVNPSQQVPARQKTYTIGDISGGYCVVNMLSVNATAGLVMLGIYSRPTGSGDAVPGFFKSRKVYTIPSGAELTQGMTVLLYWGLAPDSRLFPDVKRIECTLASSIGPGLSTENLAFLTLNTDSGALAGNSEYIVSHAGWIYGAEHIHNTEFTAQSDSVSAGDASASNQQLQLTQATNSNLSLSSRLDQINTSIQNSNLVTSTILEILGDNIPITNYGLLNDTPQYVPIRADSSGNLFVHDARATAQLVECVTQITEINEILTDLTDGTQQMYVTLSGADDSVSVMAYNPITMMPEALTLSIDSGMKALDVHVVNQPSGYATENTLADISELVSNQSAFSRFQTEAPVSDGKLDTIITNMSLTNFNVNNLTKCDTDNVAIPGGVDINNLPAIQQVSLSGETVAVSGTFWQETQPVSIAGTVPISSGSPLDVHCYGSSDGTTFHHLKTNSQGVLKTNAIMETDENGALTSELKTGTGAYNALHCWVKNNITLEAGSTTNITALDPIPTKSQSSNNSEIANDATVNGPVSIGTADTDGYLWVSAQIQMNEVTSAGTLYLEYSAEGAVWFRGNTASESVYVNTSVSQQRVLIRPQTPCTMRYVRVYAEGTFSATGVSAWISMK